MGMGWEWDGYVSFTWRDQLRSNVSSKTSSWSWIKTPYRMLEMYVCRDVSGGCEGVEVLDVERKCRTRLLGVGEEVQMVQLGEWMLFERTARDCSRLCQASHSDMGSLTWNSGERMRMRL